MLTAHTQIGFEIWRVIFAFLLAICFASFVFACFAKDLAIGLGSLVASVIVAGVAVWGLWPPFSTQYHTVVPYTGVVKSVGSRLLAGSEQGSGSTQVFPFQFANGDIRRCDDSRCSLVKPGMTVTLLCVRDFQWNAVPGWDCNWGKLGPNN